jgi:hypothetical protein
MGEGSLSAHTDGKQGRRGDGQGGLGVDGRRPCPPSVEVRVDGGRPARRRNLLSRQRPVRRIRGEGGSGASVDGRRAGEGRKEATRR